jgi:membrane protease subunit HflC
LVSVYAGWKIADPRKFLERFNGDINKAEQTLEPLIRNAKTGVIGQHAFSDLVSTNVANLKFDLIEQEILKVVKGEVVNTYGIDVEFLGIKQLGLPESITSTIFERMRAERQRLVARYQSEGEREAKIIRANADAQANDILSTAKAEAIRITGEADSKAATYYAEFEKSPQLAVFLFQLKALEASLKEKTSLILDQQTPPFNMLNGAAGAGTTGSGRK